MSYRRGALDAVRWLFQIASEKKNELTKVSTKIRIFAGQLPPAGAANTISRYNTYCYKSSSWVFLSL